MAAPISSVAFTWRDYNGESAVEHVFINTLTAGNIVAQTTAINTLANALEAVTLGNMASQTITLSRTPIDGTLPTNPFAQRETKWLLRYHSVAALKRFVSEVPNADLSLLTPNTDLADMTGAEFAALKTIWEQVVRDPDDNELTILDSAQHVGRNT